MALFPIGDICKPEVRRLAAEADLPSAEKKDSQGICFVGKVDLPVFLQQKLKSVEGDVVEVYDAFFNVSPQYQFIRATLASLMVSGSEDNVNLITDYISDDKSAHSEAGSFEGGCRVESIYDFDKIRALSDEDFLRLSEPVTYDGIKFETETYRSGKHHIKKTRYKANPYGAVVGRHEGGAVLYYRSAKGPEYRRSQGFAFRDFH